MDFARMIPIFRRLALQAGDRIMEVYNGPDFAVKTKSDASPVTEADEAADALISAGLRAEFPDLVPHPENPDIPSPERAHSSVNFS